MPVGQQNVAAEGHGRPRNAVLYVRVSSKEQQQEGFSIPAQQKLLRAYAESNGLVVLREFEDVETAKQTGRPGFNAMIEFVKRAPGCRVVLVEKTDRLYRNIRDWVTIDGLHLEIHLVKEGAILSDDSRSSEKFMHGIKVLMAKNYIDNLSEEVRKGMREKAEQGHWPTVAKVGYLNNRETHRIEVDPVRGPLVAQLFEWYAAGTESLQTLTAKAYAHGLRHPRSERRMSKSEIHRILHDPIYYGEFEWKGRRYRGRHQPLITKELFDKVQAVFDGGNRPRYAKHRHAFAGRLTCGRCGCAITAELHKGRYLYYRCTGFKGPCGNTYVREEKLQDLFADVVRRVAIPADVAEGIAKALRESQADKEREHRAGVMRRQQRYLAVQGMLDRAYDDRLRGGISEDLWARKSREWEAELDVIRAETGKRERASHDYAVTGSKILELAKNAYRLFGTQKPPEQARLLKTLLLNCTFDRGSLYPTYTSPFDLLVKGNETGDWLGGRDSNPDNVVQRGKK
jgi:DNA invertase Pin-like site-specific DNA recombinase